MHVLLTGAAGYVGTAAIEVLRRDHALRLFDANPVPDSPDAIVGDIADFATVAAAMDGVEAVVHLAVLGSDGYETPDLPMRVNVQGTANVFEAARRAGIRRVVHMSSGAVVTGYSRDTFIHVELPHAFSGLYALTKSLQERIAQYYAATFGMTVVALRPWSVCDARTMTHKRGGPVRYGPGYFGYVDRYDLTEACALGLTAPLEGFQPFHIMATEEGERWFDMQRTHHVLGWRPQETFASLKGKQGSGERGSVGSGE